MHPVSCCYLPSDVAVYNTTAELAWSLDMPGTTLPVRSIILQGDPVYAIRFPNIRVDHDPFTPQLSAVLYERFDEISTLMLSQSQLSQRIAEEPGVPDVIALMLIDGLSYGNVRHWLDQNPDVHVHLAPCLVDGPTLTGTAFPRIIGDMPPAVRLFDRGYRRRLGFTYWLREQNPLTDVIFRTIADVNAVGDFSTILAATRREIHSSLPQKIYLQILRTGLDGYAHHQKRKPPVAAIVEMLMDEMLSLASLFREAGCTARIHLTADHGILWRDQFEPQVVGRAPAGASPRTCEWRDLYRQDESGRRFVVAGREIYCLAYPKLRRALRIDEQGVHGGISFQESIVPFLTIKIGDTC
jgi:hypothetical protein